MAQHSQKKLPELPIPVQEGKIPFHIPSVDHPCFTYFKIFGDLDCGAPRLLVLHGGPGGGHEYLLAFAELWPRYGIPVVFYDQIGCASSTHLLQKAGDDAFWQESLFIDELDNLLDNLHLRDGPGYHLLGHSWGGMLGSAFAATRPKGLQNLVLYSPIASLELNVLGTRLLIQDLPSDAQQVIFEKERSGELEDPDYKVAVALFNRTYLYHGDPPPQELELILKNFDSKAYFSMMGPTIFKNTGSLKTWTVISRLHRITTPTLVYNGDADTSHGVAIQPFFDLIPHVRWITLPNATHLCHLQPELRERILKLVGEFVAPAKATEGAGLGSGKQGTL